MIEMRSDTFTLPTAAMITAMASAELGDDVYGEDPTVRRLEEEAAALVGKESACLMPSGTMANLCALLAQAPRGTKAVVGNESDIYLYEAGGAAVCGGVVYAPVATRPNGELALADLDAEFPDEPEDPQFALPAVVCVENTHNRCGGRVLAKDYLDELRHFADARRVALHLDGARLFNAAVASGRSAADIAAVADTVQFCLSKGLGAPVGSILAGSHDVLVRARRLRKMLGGGMRQAGVLAAAGRLALTTMTDRLAEDHEHARRLAEGLADIPGVLIGLETVETNIVLFRIAPERMGWQRFVDEVGEQGLAVAGFGHDRVRAVTHHGIGAAEVDRAIGVVARVLAR
ncbi:GntG family PLP-dependent aldolase [Paractinoplanes hotanensis]|uniref:Beta-eliminating lyase-related protein n=1 Tax=Paractinoplanes hotanensis TaxID=2906497 RepID=A0ABT0YAP2_9ACTN|nr:GntG family PLP-dependent aldolase [Actinoplanes hotanensis]MCM4083107.1 beta-eliminating lyase-related protein [Actinoplanes hotanensis]